MIVCDVRTGTPVDVLIDGQKVATATSVPGRLFRITVPPGATRIEARAGGAVLAVAPLSIPARQPNQPGYRALFVVGPPRGYAIVRKAYVASTAEAPPSVILPIATPSPLALLPADVEPYDIERIDDPFPTSQELPLGRNIVWLTHLCSQPSGCANTH